MADTKTKQNMDSFTDSANMQSNAKDMANRAIELDQNAALQEALNTKRQAQQLSNEEQAQQSELGADQHPSNYHKLSEHEKEQYWGTRIDDLLGSMHSGRKETFRVKSVGAKIVKSIEDLALAIEVKIQMRHRMEYLQQYYHDLAMEQKGRRDKLKQHYAVMLAAQAGDKALVKEQDEEYQALLNEAQELDQKIAELNFNITVHEDMLTGVKTQKIVLGSKIQATQQLITNLKGPNAFAHLPQHRQQNVRLKQQGIQAKYAVHLANIANNIKGVVVVPAALSSAMPKPPTYRSEDPDSLQEVIDYCDNFLNQRGPFSLSEYPDHPLDQIAAYSSDDEHEKARLLNNQMLIIAVQSATFREMQKIGPNRLLDANFQPTDQHEPNGHILPNGLQYHQFEENGPYYVLSDEQMALVKQGQEINKDDYELLDDLAQQHLANEHDFCFQPSVYCGVRQDIEDTRQHETDEVEHKETQECRNEHKEELKKYHADYAALTEIEDGLSQTLQDEKSELKTTTIKRAKVQTQIEAHPAHKIDPKKKPAPQAQKTPPVAKMSTSKKRAAPELKPSAELKSDLDKLLEMIRISEKTKCPELQQKVIDKINEFEDAHGKQLDILAKNDPQLRDIRKRIDGVNDYFQYRLDRQSGQSQQALQPQDQQVKPGWPFTQEQMYRDIEYANRMETTLSDKFNSEFSADSVENKNEATKRPPSPYDTPTLTPDTKVS